MIRVLLVDDDALVRTGLRLMFGGAPDIEVVGEAADGADVADAVSRLRPDVILMDVRMPVLDGIAATRAVANRNVANGTTVSGATVSGATVSGATVSGAGANGAGAGRPAHRPQVIVLTTFDSDATVLEALRAGAAGFLVKHTPPERIVDAVRRAAAGEPALSPTVARTLIDHVAAGDRAAATRRQRARERLAGLSGREREVAAAVAQGLSNSEIAERLYMSVGTVKAHISSALAKLDIDNRVQLALLSHDAE